MYQAYTNNFYMMFVIKVTYLAFIFVFGISVIMIQGYHVWLQSGSDWPRMGEQTRDFFRSDFRQNLLKSNLKKSRICPL